MGGEAVKRGGPSHPKTLDLAAYLGLDRWGAVGILETLFHWASQYARRGDIGKHSAKAIAIGIGWTGDHERLIEGLLMSGWLDKCECHKLRIHDWPEHADQSVCRSKDVLTLGFIECYSASFKLAANNQKRRSSGVRRKADGTGRKADGAGKTEAAEAVNYWLEKSGVAIREASVREDAEKRAAARLREPPTTLAMLKACVDYAVTDDFYRGKGYHKQPVVFWKNRERVVQLSGESVAAVASPTVPQPKPKALLPDRAATLEEIRAAQKGDAL